jgi:hypothetical protein
MSFGRGWSRTRLGEALACGNDVLFLLLTLDFGSRSIVDGVAVSSKSTIEIEGGWLGVTVYHVLVSA